MYQSLLHMQMLLPYLFGREIRQFLVYS